MIRNLVSAPRILGPSVAASNSQGRKRVMRSSQDQFYGMDEFYTDAQPCPQWKLGMLRDYFESDWLDLK